MVRSLAAQGTATCAKVSAGHQQASLPSVLAACEAACVHLGMEKVEVLMVICNGKFLSLLPSSFTEIFKN